MNANASRKPTSNASTAWVMRLRSSSRCSRNVIRPSAGSSSSSLLSPTKGERARSSLTVCKESSLRDCGPGNGTSAIGQRKDVLLTRVRAARDRRRLVDHRPGLRRRRGRSGLLLLFELDLLLERVLLIGRGTLELVDALAEGFAEFGQFARAEDDERDHQDDDQLGHADGTKHCCLPENRANGLKYSV